MGHISGVREYNNLVEALNKYFQDTDLAIQPFNDTQRIGGNIIISVGRIKSCSFGELTSYLESYGFEKISISFSDINGPSTLFFTIKLKINERKKNLHDDNDDDESDGEYYDENNNSPICCKCLFIMIVMCSLSCLFLMCFILLPHNKNNTNNDPLYNHNNNNNNNNYNYHDHNINSKVFNDILGSNYGRHNHYIDDDTIWVEHP